MEYVGIEEKLERIRISAGFQSACNDKLEESLNMLNLQNEHDDTDRIIGKELTRRNITADGEFENIYRIELEEPACNRDAPHPMITSS